MACPGHLGSAASSGLDAFYGMAAGWVEAWRQMAAVGSAACTLVRHKQVVHPRHKVTGV